MPALYIMIPAALLIVAIAVYIFFWAVDSGQYDDLDSPAHSILFDDQDPQHMAAVDEAKSTHAHETTVAGDKAPPHA
ncbi:cbb3-type cytochrome oxidase assembly protein CcoS [Pseudomonas psychrophila]|uniref:cbb3-type cytochrome oxidase assembly protein CcoS n=1 Tax=Pseudomonas psychrophila TaxID=122355 RepID=UPI0002ED0F69|nr:cbb3-type cytochrome oxidase assembly protein CcoS [Pseudomonas psychrophila]